MGIPLSEMPICLPHDMALAAHFSHSRSHERSADVVMAVRFARV